MIGRGADILTETRQILALPLGFIVLLSDLDMARGRLRHRGLRLDAAGAVIHSHDLDRAGEALATRLQGRVPAQAAYGHLALAAATSPGLLRRYAVVETALDRAVDADRRGEMGEASGHVQKLVVAGGVLVALEGQSGPGADPRRQHLHLIRPTRGPSGIEVSEIEIAVMRLGPGRSITGIAGQGDLVWVAVSDMIGGFDLYRIDPADADPRPEWVIGQGGGRFALNAAVSAFGLDPLSGELWLGTAAMAGWAEAVGNWGPELLVMRAGPDPAALDLVFGQPRLSEAGLLVPSCGLLPGGGTGLAPSGSQPIVSGGPGNAAIRALALTTAGGATRAAAVVQDLSGPGVTDRLGPDVDLSDYAGAVRLVSSRPRAGSQAGPSDQPWVARQLDLPEGVGSVTALVFSGGAEPGWMIGHDSLDPDVVPLVFVPEAAG